MTIRNKLLKKKISQVFSFLKKIKSDFFQKKFLNLSQFLDKSLIVTEKSIKLAQNIN